MWKNSFNVFDSIWNMNIYGLLCGVNSIGLIFSEYSVAMSYLRRSNLIQFASPCSRY